MNFKINSFIPILLLSVVVSACSGVAPDAVAEPEDTMMEQPTAQAMEPHEDGMSESMPNSVDDDMTDGTMIESPTWYSASLTNVSTGESFTINDLKGKVILVETMAVWCSNCFRQQTNVKTLHEVLGERDDFVSLGMDIDPNEDGEKLKSFVESNGFDWMYTVSPAEVSREIASLYGGQFLNPPSTPMLIIDRHGEAHPLPFGIKSVDDLTQALQPFLDEAT